MKTDPELTLEAFIREARTEVNRCRQVASDVSRAGFGRTDQTYEDAIQDVRAAVRDLESLLVERESRKVAA